MDNWLIRAQRASGVDDDALARILGCTHEDLRWLKVHPGDASINEVGRLIRALPAEGAVVVGAMLREMGDVVHRPDVPGAPRMD